MIRVPSNNAVTHNRIVHHATRLHVDGPSYRDRESEALNKSRRAAAHKKSPPQVGRVIRAPPPALDAPAVRARTTARRRFRRNLAAAFPLASPLLDDPAFPERHNTTPHDHAAVDALRAADPLLAALVLLPRLDTAATGRRSRSRR